MQASLFLVNVIPVHDDVKITPSATAPPTPVLDITQMKITQKQLDIHKINKYFQMKLFWGKYLCLFNRSAIFCVSQ